MAKKRTTYNVGQEPEKPLEERYEAIVNDEQFKPIYGEGIRAKLEELLNEADVEKAMKMFSCRHDEAMKALKEFKPALHKIMQRMDKKRLNKEEYETSKLSRAYQKVTNQTGTFFMFGNNISLSLKNKRDEAEELQPYFNMYTEFLDSIYFNQRMYVARQIAGSETECAKLFKIVSNDNGKNEVVCQLKSNDQGDMLYTIFNENGRLIAFALGYSVRNLDLKLEEHFDVYTSAWIWKFRKSTEVGSKQWISDQGRVANLIGKIPVIYYHHEVDWEGAQPRIEKLEWRDSKHSDTVEYFGDPYLLMTADIADNLLADARETGKVMVLDNKDGRFEFVAPPDSGDMVKQDKDDLKASIDQDTMSPDWTYKGIMGLGTLSGEAMRRANLPGYVKRTKFSTGCYDELILRELNLIREILCQYVYADKPDVVAALRKMKFKFTYTDPFVGGIEDNSTEIATLVGAGAMSIHAAVRANRHIEDKEAEEERIWEERERMAMIEARAKAQIEKENKETKEE